MRHYRCWNRILSASRVGWWSAHIWLCALQHKHTAIQMDPQGKIRDFLLLLIQYMPNSMAGKTSESITCHIKQMMLNLKLRCLLWRRKLGKIKFRKAWCMSHMEWLWQTCLNLCIFFSFHSKTQDCHNLISFNFRTVNYNPFIRISWSFKKLVLWKYRRESIHYQNF